MKQINYKKGKVNVKSFEESHKEFDKLILKTQQIFKSKRYSVFAEKVNNIP